jgi:DNA recombination protein Rad52
MSKDIIIVNQELDADIPRSAVSSRQGGGGASLSYLAGWYVIDRLNKVFGPLGWASQTTKLELVHSGEIDGKFGKTCSVHYIAQVRLVVKVGDVATEHTCTGYGDGTDKQNIGKAHELAVKEAETDALKRAAKNLGMSMGLALYDKDQERVEDASTNNQPKVAQPSAHKASPEAAPTSSTDRERNLKLVTATSKVIISQGKDTVDGLKAKMKQAFNTDVKENLNDADLEILLATLKGIANGQ